MALTSTYNNNTPTPAPPSTVGFRISKPGYDANRTSGSNMLFDSSWPSLPIAFETTIANPITSTSSTATVAHNLKYPPLTFIWALNTNGGIANAPMRVMQAANVDSTNVYLTGGQLDGVQQNALLTASKLNIKCFAVDLSTDIDYTLAPGDTFNLPYDNSYGIKVVKNGKDINSKDMRDFALHSRCQSPLILAVKTQKTGNNGAQSGYNGIIQYQNPTTTPVWVYGYVKKSNGQYQWASMYTQAYPRLFSDGLLSYIGWTGSDIGASLVILRDPMFAPNPITVQY